MAARHPVTNNLLSAVVIMSGIKPDQTGSNRQPGKAPPMIINESRQRAIELTRNYAEAINFATGKSVDFYQLLWIMHWAIETHGLDKTRDALENIMLSKDFAPDSTPMLLRDYLLTSKDTEDRLEEWFNKSMSA